MLCIIGGIIKLIKTTIRIITIKYTVNILSGLAFFFIIFNFLVFPYTSSIFLQGMYKIYEINTPAAKGAKIPSNSLNQFVICPKLSTVLYTKIVATANVNQYNHFVHVFVFFSILFFLLYFYLLLFLRVPLLFRIWNEKISS